MKKLFLIAAGLLFGLSACVDDYTDSNPPHKLDAPNLRVNTVDADAAVKPAGMTGFDAYVLYGSGPVEFTVSVIDAPGEINSASISSSVEEFGTVTLNESSFNAIKGQTSGEFKFTLTPSTVLPDMSDRGLNITVTVSDSQLDEDGESAPLSSSLTIPVTLTAGCLTSTLATGVYVVTNASGTRYNYGEDAEDDADDFEEPYDFEFFTELSPSAFGPTGVQVTITQVRPGVYAFSDASGGFTSIDEGAPGDINLNLCGNTLESRDGENVSSVRDTYFVNGTVNSDGSITVQWSWDWTSANGTYTLKKAF